MLKLQKSIFYSYMQSKQKGSFAYILFHWYLFTIQVTLNTQNERFFKKFQNHYKQL